jgi:diguanylate cyclase (GGDEF)-like protein/PAS domain S-box-containing protein
MFDDAVPGPCRVLLIEDQAPEAEYIQELLGQPRGGYSLVHCDRLQSGLEALAQQRFDVLLLDLCLPDSVGYDTFEAARRVAGEVPIILMTNIDDEALADRAVRNGAQDYLVKRHVKRDGLVRAIRYAIERQRVDNALRQSEERYALAVRGANDGVWDWSPVSGEAYWSARWEQILGFAEGELEQRFDAWVERVHPDDRAEFERALQAHLAGEEPQFALEYRLRAKDGGYVWVLSRGLAVLDERGKPIRMAGSLTDITDRKLIEAQLVYDTLHDSLTGLPNRTLLMDRLELALDQSSRGKGRDFAVLLLDLDRFKMVNDSYGHGIGDQLLMRIARILEEKVRPGDTVARLGGDEFAVVVTGLRTPSEITHLAGRMVTACERQVRVSGREVFTSASIGIALGSRDYQAAEELLRDADIALYRAKAAGRGTYKVFDQRMHARVMALQQMEIELKRALDRQEFVIHYQPIVALGRDRILGFEALLRWRHPERGLVPPSEFIPVAEETGVIVPLGWWTLRTACRQMQQWRSDFPEYHGLSLSVNISERQFGEPDMVAVVKTILEETGLPPQDLCLEVTESLLLDHVEAALNKLAQLQRLGVKLHVDDFGTGYSSLSYLQKFSYDSLKIDRSFVKALDGSKDANAIVKTIIALGRMMHIDVIAEGVESPEQVASLREMDCPQVQGFYFSKPLEQESVPALLALGSESESDGPDPNGAGFRLHS